MKTFVDSGIPDEIRMILRLEGTSEKFRFFASVTDGPSGETFQKGLLTNTVVLRELYSELCRRARSVI